MANLRFLKKSLSLAYRLFSPEQKNYNYHFCFGFIGQRLVGMGQNQPNRPDSRAFKIAQKFKIKHFTEYPFLHAETDLIGRLWGQIHIDRHLTIVNIRLNKRGELRCSRPCKNCQTILDALGVNKIYWTDNEENFILHLPNTQEYRKVPIPVTSNDNTENHC